MFRYNIGNDDKNRVDFPSCFYLRAKSSGLVSSMLVSSCRCNLQALYVYFNTNINADRWLHIFDVSTNEVSNLPGKQPDIVPVKVVSGGNFTWEPPLDIEMHGRAIALRLGFPFDKGIFVALSTTQDTLTLSTDTMLVSSRVFTGEAGRIPDLLEVK